MHISTAADTPMSSVQGPAMAQQNPIPQGPGALYVPVHDYHTSVPIQRQKALVPPFSLGDHETDNLIIRPPNEHIFEIGEFVPQGFFDRVDQSSEWMYSKRREAQQILPFLYLGPASVARDRDFIRSEGITLLLSIRDKRSAIARLLSGTKVAEELGIQSDAIDVNNEQELISLYPNIIRGINQHISSGVSARSGMPPRVLVFCESGNGRSASVVIAYIMTMLNMDMPSAMWAVHHRRFCIDVDESMQTLLQSYQVILDAKREVANARLQEAYTSSSLAVQPPSHQNGQLARKRSFIEYDDDNAAISTAGSVNGHLVQPNAIRVEDNTEHLKQKPAPFTERVA
ncbi:possible dual specificity protein phosphatase 3 [Talaromyces stipitatus ATCC 10500]|uniref:Possible dual specificity protein phosphatase 3 n=1 Tax=Talaromyces stipitatus (strain ATCC 10500 / CBS 375.48 / QM 6759 / NRRL 1006) TaxID=441959 RepID=B8M285_TALSN|nr:putative dual specificity protein phosphatase 3 [Talaromyces stipitatus ATCC 10500]EED21549.1 possible dual specificity protein phosphatase 3 [Talaromyces stipitatus ATCC 10500]